MKVFLLLTKLIRNNEDSQLGNDQSKNYRFRSKFHTTSLK